jgi:ribose-phosphate pyrophosphokinase
VFGAEAYGDLRAAGAERIATTNTIPHETNDIDVTSLLVDAVRTLA